MIWDNRPKKADQVKTAATKRRMYLFARAAGNLARGIRIILVLVLGIVALLLLVGGGVILYDDLPNTFLLVALAAALLVFTSSMARKLQHLTDKYGAIPYVPPVREQLTALPADEVLLRGADQPAAAPTELLRAAHAGTTEQATELLRADVRDQREARR